MAQDNVIRLLVVEDSIDDAEQLISILRNGGIALRPSRACNEAELEAAIEASIPDLVLCNITTGEITLPFVVETINRGGKDVALIVYGRGMSEDAIVNASTQGARAVALRNSAEHLQLVVRREFEALTMRRSVRRLEAALRESERRCDGLLDTSLDPIAYVHEGMHVRANRAYLEMFGFDDFIDIEGMSILDLLAPEDAADFKTLLRRLSKGEKPPQRLNIKARRSDGQSFDTAIEFAEATYEGEACQQITFRRDVVDSDVANELDALRSRDLVTELYNRQYFLVSLDQAAAAAANGRPDQALLLIEPTNFKEVLDTIGLGNTDVLLGDMANLLSRHLSDTDVAGRLADYTFGVLSCDRGFEANQKLAETLRMAFEERIFEVGKQSITFTISIGIALIGETNAAADTILDHSQTALRQAQDEGGNRVQILDPAAKDKAIAAKSRQMREQIEHALKNDGFVLYQQPIVNLRDSEGEFFEILLRMTSEQGELTPSQFLPTAIQQGLMPAIDRWVIANTIRVLAQRTASGGKPTFFIKLGTDSLADQTMLPWIAQQLKNARQPGDSLVFEIPESKAVTNLKPARAFVKGLEQLHCKFALEQFGSGLNSFQLLKHIPANYLKIDRNFVTDLPKQKENQDKIREICEQAHHLGKLTIAEFVDDAASVSLLFSCGVNFVQGNFLQAPERVAEQGST